MEIIRGKTLILNGQTADALGYTPDLSADLFYEVLRVINGKYLFLDDHLDRLSTSCNRKLAGCPGSLIIRQNLEQLVKESGISEGNVKLLVYRTGNETHIACFFIPHHYPGEMDYQKGVSVKTFKFERPDPNIKKWNEQFRKRVNKFIREESIYEAILLSEDGNLTEGSRSNLFFIDGEERVITAPLERVLPGITRKYVIKICTELHIQVLEQNISIDEAKLMVGCFISGTSPKVLPVRKLDDTFFQTDRMVLAKIMGEFDSLVKNSIDYSGLKD